MYVRGETLEREGWWRAGWQNVSKGGGGLLKRLLILSSTSSAVQHGLPAVPVLRESKGCSYCVGGDWRARNASVHDSEEWAGCLLDQGSPPMKG